MMSFLSKKKFCNCKSDFKKTSLRAYPEHALFISRKKKFLCSKRMSSFLLSAVEGSMTIEATIAIPLFLFAILNLLSIILLFGEYSSNLADMHQRAKLLSVHAHVAEEGQKVGNDLIIQTKVQRLKPVVSLMGFSPSQTIVNCRIRKWTGYDVTKQEGMIDKDEWVYITPYGESYHMSVSCRYLSLKIHSAMTEEIKNLRNKSGEIYRVCESCKAGGLSGICFYTEYGNRYHTSLLCSGLKRTIETVRISEVGNRHACSFCTEKGE